MNLILKKVVVLLLGVSMIITLTTAMSYGAVVSSSDTKYTYKDVKADIGELTAAYPDILQSEILGKTADNRNLYCLYLGNRNAPKQIFVTASMHAREYINSQVAMECVERYCKYYNTGKYKDVSYSELFGNVCIVIIPMVNPDGASIVAGGPNSIRNATLRAKIKKMYRYGGYSNWKANARGVDLNRNFKIWSGSAKKPMYAYYGGKTALSENETKAIIAARDQCTDIEAYINMHACGNMMYWGYYSRTKYKASCQSFVNMLKENMKGYYSHNESAKSNDHGDFEHYIINQYKKPYACIESGTTVPVPHYQLKTIYGKYKNVFAACAYKFK